MKKRKSDKKKAEEKLDIDLKIVYNYIKEINKWEN